MITVIHENRDTTIFVDENFQAFVEQDVTASGGIYGDTSFLSAAIKGDVLSDTTGVTLGTKPFQPQDENVTIYSGGTVTGFGFGYGAISITGFHSSVQNAGELWGNYYGVYLDTQLDELPRSSSIGNTGSIVGGTYGLYVLGSEAVNITNSGMIRGDSASFIDFSGGASQRIANSGSMEGAVMLAGGDDVYIGGHGSLTGAVFGGDGNDKIKTGADDDQIHGGNGQDRLTGGLGDDTFYFDTTPNGSTNADTITDFDPDNDMIALDHTIFGFGVGKLAASSFLASKSGAAADAGDHFLYNTTNGNLYYDADGKGGGKAELLATFLHHPDITATDFVVV